MMDVKFTGGTHFCLIALQLDYLMLMGDYYTPGEAYVPVEDADTFEELLKEENAPYKRW